jgi:hypothetical protein
MIDWRQFKYFTPSQFDDPLVPGSGENIHPLVPTYLNRLRECTGWPIWIHRTVGGAVDVNGSHGHTSDSYHLLKNGAMAVDWHFDTDASRQAQIRAVLHSNFTGIGIYYDWSKFGFHTDIRPVEKYQVWKREGGQYTYFVR